MEVLIENDINVNETSELAVESSSNTNVEVAEKDITVTTNVKEYSVVGDDIYIPKLYDDAPQWMKDLVDITVNVALQTESTDIINNVNNLLSNFATSYVPLNQYTQSINQLVTEDGNLLSQIETLNSSFNDGINQTNANVLNIQQTYATSDSVAVTVAEALSAELTNPNSVLGSTIADLNTAIADGDSTNAASITALESSLQGEVDANAQAFTTLNTFVGFEEGSPTGTSLLADIQVLQKQNDGVIETHTGTYDVMIGVDPDDLATTSDDELDVTQEPYASWLAEDLANGNTAVRSMHTGDVYIKYTSTTSGYKTYERAYKFINTVVDGTSPYATDTDGFTWALITDTDAQNAYVTALNAWDLADNKRRVFVSKPNPPYDVGDLWLVAQDDNLTGLIAESGDILRCTETKGTAATYEANDWVRADNYRESMATIQSDLDTWRNGEYATFVNNINTQVDSKAESYYQETMPHAEGNDSSYAIWVGDLWKKPSDNTEYVYQLVGSTYKWVLTDVPDVVYDTIDGKKAIYVGNDLPAPVSPVTLEVNDMWITGDNPVEGIIANSIYVWDGSNWVIPVRYTDDQYAKDIENGTKQIDLADHIDSLGWNTSINSLASDVTDISTELTQTAIDVANVDGRIDAEETARIQAILDEQAARALDIAERVAAEATLDGLITAEEQDRIDAINDVTTAYKEYSRIVALAIADGVLTQEELNTIAEAQEAVNAAKSRFVAIESNVTNILNDISNINLDLAQKALDIANLNGDISAEEQARIQAVTNETEARIAAVNARIAEEARLDGLITAEEQARIDAGTALEAAYKEYSRVITLAISDSVLTQEEIDSISEAQSAVDAAKARMLDILNEAKAYSDSTLDNFLTVTYAKDLLNIGNQLDGVAVTHFQDNEPYTALSGIAANAGDVWFDTGSEKAYKFVYKTLDASGSIITDSAWVEITNTTIINALKEASKSKAAADRSVQNFTSQPVHPYFVGDTWMEGPAGDIRVSNADSTEAEGYVASHWVLASKYTDDTAVTTLETGLGDGTVTIRLDNAYVGTTLLEDYVASEIDDQVVVYSGTDYTTQTGMKLNDIYIEKTVDTSGAVPVDVVNTYKYNGSAWIQIGDNSNLTALADLADGKRTVFAGSTVPTGADERDLWIPEADNGTYKKGEVYQYLSGAWTLATTYSENLNNFVDNIYQPTVSNLQAQVDGKIEYFYYDNPTANPLTTISIGWSNAEHGNVVYYKDTDQGYWYNGSLGVFEQLIDTSMLKALREAEDAQATADGKVTNYYAILSTTAPSTSNLWMDNNGTLTLKEYTNAWIPISVQDGDMVKAVDPIDNTNNRDYTYASGNWVEFKDGGVYANASAITQLDTELSNGTNTWSSADSTLENSLTTKIDNDVATVESKFEYNSLLNINGLNYSSGFGLVSSATNTGSTPNPVVTGSEFWIRADKFRLITANQTGAAKEPFTVDGVSGDITFNGKVSFNSVTEKPTHTSGAGNPTGSAVEGSTYRNTADNSFWSYTDGQWVQGGNPDALVAEDLGSAGTTVIDGGRIVTGSISASQINTTGLIAENITTTELIGKNIIGATITGAQINGSVLKTSYIDLDDTVQYFTNYHISLSKYNANPSLWTDAVLNPANNSEYRIPTLSSVAFSPNSSNGLANGAAITSTTYAYNKGNAGNNLKALKIRPYIVIPTDNTIVKGGIKFTGSTYIGFDYEVKLGTISIIRVIGTRNVNGSIDITISGDGANTVNQNIFYSTNIQIPFSNGGFQFEVIHEDTIGGEVKLKLLPMSSFITKDWNSDGSLQIIGHSGTFNKRFTTVYTVYDVEIPSGISINNLL